MTVEEYRQKYHSPQAKTRVKSAEEIIAELRSGDIKKQAINDYKQEQQTQASNKEPGLGSKIISGVGKFGKSLGEFGIGMGKGALSTVKETSSLGEKILRKPLEAAGMEFGDETAAEELIPESATTAKNTAQKAGKFFEQTLEYFLPAGKAAKVERTIDLLSAGIRSNLLASGTRIAGKALTQAVSAGGVSLLQTGDKEKAQKTALTAGTIRGGMAIIGEGARALHIPERIYSTIFKNSKQDMMSELKADALYKLKQTNPQKYQEFVDNGIIKISKNGNPTINDTLAEKALDMGLKGSIRNMSSKTVEGALESEMKVRNIANAYKGKINLSEPQIKNVLNNIADDYRDVGFGEIANEADNLVDVLEKGKGQVSAIDALNVRRLFDRVRIASSFDKPVTKLSQTQGNLKTLADAVRGRVNNIPKMGEVMKDYSFYIDALEALAVEAMRRGNNQVLSLIDSLFLSGAYAGNNPIPGVTMGMARKLLQSSSGATYLGSALKNQSVSPVSQGLISSGSAGVQSGQINQ